MVLITEKLLFNYFGKSIMVLGMFVYCEKVDFLLLFISTEVHHKHSPTVLCCFNYCTNQFQEDVLFLIAACVIAD